MSTTSQLIRSWRGPAVLSFGFRPFFLGAALWAALSGVVWVLMLSGKVVLPTALDPVSWHAHEFLFGYLGAVIAGFLLTAIPNWTGRLPIVGWPLATLFGLWLLGRAVVASSALLPTGLVIMVDLSMPIALAIASAREIYAGQNWRNLAVLAMLVAFIVANGVFHVSAAEGEYAAQGIGMRLGVAAAVMMVAVIGGRIVPSFTRNWLAKRGASRKTSLPAVQVFDRAALIVLLAALAVWVFAPFERLTGLFLLGAGAFHLLRLARWKGWLTFAEPLVLILHGAYLFLPIGLLVLGLEILVPGTLGMATAQHVLMAGVIGSMTLAVMTRATLGHTGRSLSAGPATTLIYAAVIVSVFSRVGAGVWLEHASLFHAVSGWAWFGAFAGFVFVYGPLLISERKKSGGS
ncbi:NnrS family protein [Pseudovibrio exalbescens]|uniref:Short-chain dehydrogenase n=1 Tax=Pseudovibrio exalbescens TaxID=197461 RepID=A0A1U7JGE7_9HYPH|nr:NnrS family protein [Pseudovibrio exalbescens]OKL43764.1 short-chain dehydrogenase [Pseudovibrio exalbescens]